MSLPQERDDLPTVAAIAVVAFAAADLAHEVIGHGAGYLATGGGPCVLTSTRLIQLRPLGELGGRIFSLGGPLGNLALAGLSLTLLSRGRRAGAATRCFLYLSGAFNLLWAFGYLIYSGVTAGGDWAGRRRPRPRLRPRSRGEDRVALRGLALLR